MRQFVRATLLACLVGAATLPSAASAAAPQPGRLSVGVQVLHFAAAGKSVQAQGLVTGSLTDNAGHTSTVRSAIALTAATGGGGCRVLHLDLKELTLQLLGLNAHLDRVVLDITGNRSGGVLGALFCKLAHAKTASARRAGVHALNAGLRSNRIRGKAVRFTAYLQPQTRASAAPAPAPPAAPSCQVLDLVVGPLNLQLLGLVVDLNRVHLSVTATPSQGKLGALFCSLATP